MRRIALLHVVSLMTAAVIADAVRADPDAAPATAAQGAAPGTEGADGTPTAGAPGDLWDLYSSSKKAMEEGRATSSEPSLFAPNSMDAASSAWEALARQDAERRTAEARLARAKSAPDFLLITRQARMTSDFGLRADPFHGGPKTHAGVDLAAPQGTKILAGQTGVVRFAGTSSGYGTMLELEHADGTRSRYAHCSRLLVDEGARVRRGQIVAEVGSTGRSTGPHLHFEVRRGGEPIDPIRTLARWAREAEQQRAAARALADAEAAAKAKAKAKAKVKGTPASSTTPLVPTPTSAAPAARAPDPF